MFKINYLKQIKLNGSVGHSLVLFQNLENGEYSLWITREPKALISSSSLRDIHSFLLNKNNNKQYEYYIQHNSNEIVEMLLFLNLELSKDIKLI